MRGQQNLDVTQEDLQRLTDLGRLSASLLHEISNPLSVALLHLDQVGDQTSQNIKHIRRSLTRLARYVNAARAQVRRESVSSNFSINSQLSDIRRLVGPYARSNYVSLKISKVSGLNLSGDPLKFQQILVNLIVNAIEAYPKASKLSSDRLVSVDVKDKISYLAIDVNDKGPGIDKDKLPKLFEPFYTTKSTGHGLGLGLVIVKRYVENSFNGSIRVISSKTKGTRFSLRLPK